MNKKFVLKRNEEIGALISRRQSVGNKYYAIYYKKNEFKRPRIAISVSKRYGNAVKRNYEKRVTREIMREIIPLLPNLDILIVIKKELQKQKFNEKDAQLKYLFRKITKKIGD